MEARRRHREAVTGGEQVKNEPIHVNDRLRDPASGRTWMVIETRPGGHVELFDKERVRFWGTYHKIVKGWERLTAAPPRAAGERNK